MKIFVDENIPKLTVNTLREKGHDITDIRGTPYEGISDDEIWTIVQNEKRLLITTDKGFTGYRNHTHHGILIIILKHPNCDKIHQMITQAMNNYKEKDWYGQMVIIKDNIQSVWKK